MRWKAWSMRAMVFALAQLWMVESAPCQRSVTAKEIKADALKEKLDRGEKVLIIDVRTDDEVKGGTIPGALHIPMDQLTKRMKDIPKGVQLVFT